MTNSFLKYHLKTLCLKCLLIPLSLLTINCSAQYYTGQRVFENRFPKENKDYNQDTYIKIENTSGDIIVAVENISTGRVIQHAYIKSYDNYKFTYIPIGTYVCKYMWTDSNGRKRYEKDDSTMRFGYNEVGGYVITLQQTQFGNLSQHSISENEFFK